MLPLNPHPPLTGFPVVIVVLLLLRFFSSLLARVSGEEPVKRFLLLALLFATPCAYLSGYIGATFAAEDLSPLIATHQAWALFSLILTLALVACAAVQHYVAARKAVLEVVYAILLLSLAVSVFATAATGGSLVFDHGAAVNVQKD